MNFPSHKCGLYLEHNRHRDLYQTARDWITEEETREVFPDWKDEAAKQKAIDTDEVWTLQWYPNTPIGFNFVAAPTLEELLAYAAEYKA